LILLIYEHERASHLLVSSSVSFLRERQSEDINLKTLNPQTLLTYWDCKCPCPTGRTLTPLHHLTPSCHLAGILYRDFKQRRYLTKQCLPSLGFVSHLSYWLHTGKPWRRRRNLSMNQLRKYSITIGKNRITYQT
jgi:hypothetical protein